MKNTINTNFKIYNSPLCNRYASSEMLYNFSYENKIIIWRKLWLSLAKAQQKVGINISNEQLKEIETNIYNIDYTAIFSFEKEIKHEVMANLKAFAKVCPLSAPIIHLGETSAFLIDNSDIIIYKEALNILAKKLYICIKVLSKFCNKYKELPTLAFTHLQVAQPTTVGKRASLWLHSLLMDFKELVYIINNLKLRGVKGSTGTAASFKKLVRNYEDLIKIDQYISNSFNFKSSYEVTSQTYDRKIDVFISSILLQIAISSHKITNDLRLLQHFKEISEPFSRQQVGSSAMPYKRNPILSERISSLAKFIISMQNSTTWVASTQWLERTLDDSANKRIVLPEIFLATDSILELFIEVFSGLTVYKNVIESNLKRELPFLISENILMLYVKNGGNRQEGHERIREHAMKAFNEMQCTGVNNFLMYIASDPFFNITQEELNNLINSYELTGFAKEQVVDFLTKEVNPLLEQYKDLNK